MEENIDKILREEVPKELLSDEQFNKVSTMKKHEAIKEINELTGIGLKLSAYYYDEYIKEQL